MHGQLGYGFTFARRVGLGYCATENLKHRGKKFSASTSDFIVN